MVGIEEVAYLPREPKPKKIRGWDYYEIAELALIQVGRCPLLVPIASIGLKKIGSSYCLLFSEATKQIEYRFIPSALDPQSEKLENILVYLPSEKLKHRD
jgi:hypothetical protein